MRIYPITKLLTMAAAFAVVTSVHAQEQSVYSVNIVGFQKVELADQSQFSLMSVPFDIGDGTLGDIFGTNTLYGSASPGLADRLRFWDTAEQVYVNVGVGPDGKFYRQTSGGGWVSPLEEVNFEVELGEGFWIVSSGEAGSDRDVILAGDVIADESFSYNFFTGFHVLAFPFSAPIDLQDTSFASSGASASAAPGAADRVRVWDRDEQAYVNYGLGPDGNWYLQTSAGAWVSPLELADHTLQPGEAFFYFAQESFTWTEPNPYLDIFSAD